MTSTEAPFTIAVPDAALALLQQKLALTTFPDEIEDAGWDYGAPLADIRRLVERWRDGYNWRTYEAQLNSELPQFTRDIEVEGFGSLNVHYIHKRSALVDHAIPLLFVHGWPGSFLEVRKILPLLTSVSPQHPTFHVVAFSLPGFGFSEAPRKKGFARDQFAELGHKLMIALGYNEYVTQGGDWGHWITHSIATNYGPRHSKAMHSNFPTGHAPTPAPDPSTYTPAEQAGLKRTEWFNTKGSGYFAEQSTQPQTLGYSLAASPVGLLAWIYEKLVAWTDAYPWDDDEILTWISIYWFSRAGPAASVRIYYEVAKTLTPPATALTLKAPSDIPLGYSTFSKDAVVYPLSWVKTPNLVVHFAHEEGGHFAAYERPADLVGDVRSMFGKGGAAFGVVPGKTGYA